MTNLCLVGVKKCGCAVVCALDYDERPEKDLERLRSDWKRRDLHIEKRSSDWVAQNLKACVHEVPDYARS